MQIKILLQAPESIETEALGVIAFEKEGDAGSLSATAAVVNAATGGWILDTYSSGEFEGKPSELGALHRPAGLKAKRLVVIGSGKRTALSAATVRKAAGAFARHVKGSCKTACLVLDTATATEDVIAAAVEGAMLGAWEQDHHKTSGKRESKMETFSLSVPGGRGGLVASAGERGRVLAESQNISRDIINEPGNLLTPRKLVEAAQAMASENGLECEVLDQDRMRQLGMGALLGVAQGSAEAPFLIVLRYKPAAAGPEGVHLGLVGKGVTFDTGGISIKPADGMEKMKNDMAGAGATIGAMRAIAKLKPAIPVTGVIPTVENMPGDRAQRPGDIVKSLSGKTIEVLNTDAEGRLILVDAVTYAKRLGCTHLVDAATLTGAVGVALGAHYTGLFSNNEAFRDRVLAAAAAEGEPMWHLPSGEEYREQLKSAYADLANIGGRAGGASTGATFIQDWVEDTPWVHLDIAYTAYLDEAKPFLAKGATGVAVRTFARLALDWK